MLLPGGVVLAVGVASFMRAPLLPEIGRDLEIGAADLAFLTTGFAVGRLVIDLPAGRGGARRAAGGAGRRPAAAGPDARGERPRRRRVGAHPRHRTDVPAGADRDVLPRRRVV